MSSLSNQDVAQAFDHISGLLISQHIVQGSEDEAALMKAMESIARKLAESDANPSKPDPRTLPFQTFGRKTRAITPEIFKEKTVFRMTESTQKRESRLETMRKQQYTELILQMREKPVINPTSRKMVSTRQVKDQKPIFERAEELLLRKKERIRKLQYEKAAKGLRSDLESSSFRPLSSQPSLTRSHKEFRDQALIWLQKRETNIASLQREKQAAELEAVQDRPKISDHSEKLTMKVRTRQQDRSGLISERLYKQSKRRQNPPELPFRPALSINTRKLTESRAKTPVHERLFSLSFRPNHTPEPLTRTQRKPKQTHSKSADLSFEKSYKININPGAADEKASRRVNEVQYEGNLGFLWKTMGQK